MQAVLVKYYDKPLGQQRRLSGELKLVSERVTAADLIRRRVEQEFEAANDTNSSWLVVPQKKEAQLNGSRSYGSGSKVNHSPDVAVATALKGFRENSFLMFVDNQQVATLDTPVTISGNCAITFIKLVPLVGG